MSNIREILDAEESALVTKPGDVLAEVEVTGDCTSQTDGECLKVKARALDGEEKGKLIICILSKAPQAAFRIRQLVEACGKDPSAINDSEELVGCQVRIKLAMDTWQGEPRLKVKSFARAV